MLDYPSTGSGYASMCPEPVEGLLATKVLMRHLIENLVLGKVATSICNAWKP